MTSFAKIAATASLAFGVVTSLATAQSAAPSLIGSGACIAFNKDGTCAVLAGNAPVVTPAPITTTTAVLTAPTATFQAGAAAIPVAPPVAANVSIQGLQPTTVSDYLNAYAALGRFNWDGVHYGGQAHSHSLEGWTAGAELGRGALFAMGRLGHYTESSSTPFEAGDLTIHHFGGLGPATVPFDTTFEVESRHNIYEGALGFRSALGTNFSGSLSLYGRRDNGTYDTTINDTVSPVNQIVLLDEDITSQYYGIRLGLNVSAPIAPQLRLRGSAGIAPVRVEHDYTYDFLVAGVSAANNTLSLNDYGYIADGRLAIEYTNGSNLALSLGGFGNYVSHGLDIIRPDASAPTATPAIGFEEAYEAGVTVGLSVGF